MTTKESGAPERLPALLMQIRTDIPKRMQEMTLAVFKKEHPDPTGVVT